MTHGMASSRDTWDSAAGISLCKPETGRVAVLPDIKLEGMYSSAASVCDRSGKAVATVGLFGTDAPSLDRWNENLLSATAAIRRRLQDRALA